jgi:hypothetical protein
MRLVHESSDVDEAFDPFLDFDERAVRDEVRDLALDALAHGETALRLVPGILLRLLEAERHTLFLTVDVEDDGLHFLADLEQLARVAEAAPGHVGDVEQAVHAVEVDEGAEVGEVLHVAADDVADLGRVEEMLALLRALLLDELAPGEDDVLAVVVDLDDLEIVGVADVDAEVFRRDDVDL